MSHKGGYGASASSMTSTESPDICPFPAEESVITIQDDRSVASDGNVAVRDAVNSDASPKSHNETADTAYTKGDSTMIGLNETAISEESSFEQEKGPEFVAGSSLPDGRPKRAWMALAFFVIIAGAVAIIAIFFITRITIFVAKAPQGESDSSAQVSPPQLGDVATLSPTFSFSSAPSIATSHPTKSPQIPSQLPPTRRPTAKPTKKPTAAPTMTPQIPQTRSPQLSPTMSPVVSPSQSSSNATGIPTAPWDASAAPSTVAATYIPGNLTRQEVGLLLSEGLRARIIATSGKPVKYYDGTFSSISFHGAPDFGATFPDTRPFNEGGWVYTSNSEMEDKGKGGVGSLTFNKEGNIIDYRMVLQNTTMNCGGGATPWGTWVSCEEVEFFGEIYQVDPFGEIPAQPATIGSQLGRWESFAYDVRDPQDPRFFATEDHNKGTVRRFRPEQSLIDWDNPWNMLHVNGTIDYLIVHPNENMTGGTFEWVNDIELAKNNARSFYPQSEGIDVYDGMMYVVCKGIRQLFMFDLDTLTYQNSSTVSGLFDGGPDQMKRILDDNPSDLLYFTEEGGVHAGVHARDEYGRYFTIFEGPSYIDETTGLAFSPNGKHLYIAYQKNGLVFDIWRDDGMSFGSKTLNVKYHRSRSSQP